MGSIDLLKQTRRTYISRDTFDVHPTTRHAVADSYRHQLKGAWFCLHSGWLDPTKATSGCPAYPIDGEGRTEGKVPQCYVDVNEKGKAKLRDNFESKLYDCFHDLRFELLCVKIRLYYISRV